MWDRLFRNRAQEQHLDETITAVSRGEMIAVLILYLVWQLYRFGLGKQEENMQLLPLTLLVLSLSLLSYWLVGKGHFYGNLFWLLALGSMIFAGLSIYHNPVIGLFYAFLPLLAVVLVGWPAAVLVLILSAGVIYWFQIVTGSIPFPDLYLWIIFFGGTVNGILAWIVAGNYLEVTVLSIDNYRKARNDLEAARDERLDYQQMQADLIHANNELAMLSERLKAATYVAEEAVRVKEEFVANVSHELRTPLNMIIGFCEMITQTPKIYGKKLPPLLMADIGTIQRNSHHLADLVNDVLDLSQVDAGKMALSKQWGAFQEIIVEAVEAVHPLYLSKGLYLEKELPEVAIQVYCDRTRIREVILNLLSNAGRFTEQGGVRIKAWVEEGKAFVSIADSGPGIAPEDQERLFEPFQQVDTSIRRRSGGSGLGLSISKRFVEMHRGKLWLVSKVGEGTTFYFSLPLESLVAEGVKDHSRAERWVNPYTVSEVRDRPFRAPAPEVMPRILVFEQEGTLQRFIKRYMEGVEVLGVENINDVTDFVKDSLVRAIIVNLPKPADILQAIQSQLSTLDFKPPVISCWVPGIDEAARRLGALHYLVKPISGEALFEAMADLNPAVKRVLLVDDNADALQLFARILLSSGKGYDLIRATDGQMALRMMRERKPDVVLLDLILPGMDGFEVLDIKSSEPLICDIPVIVISSQDPLGSPIISKSIAVTRSEGLSILNVISFIKLVIEDLNPQLKAIDSARLRELPA